MLELASYSREEPCRDVCSERFIEDFAGDGIIEFLSLHNFARKEEKMANSRNRSPLGLILMLLLAFAACKKTDQANSKAVPDLAKEARAYVTIGETIVRSGPGPQFRAIGRIRGNTQIDVVGREGNWLLIVSKHGNPPGYVDARDASPFVKATQPASPEIQGEYVTVSNTDLRKGPGFEYPLVTKIPRGMKVNVVGIERGWLKIESKHGRAPGYIDQTYARRSTNQ